MDEADMQYPGRFAGQDHRGKCGLRKVRNDEEGFSEIAGCHGGSILRAICPCRARTVNLDREIHAADIVVGAVGKPRFIRAAWIGDGAVVIDAG
jgi:hypothetical protein